MSKFSTFETRDASRPNRITLSEEWIAKSMTKVSVRGIELHYEDLGAGAPIVLLGGTLGTAYGDFSKQLSAFSDDFRVIAPERRGYGGSRPPLRDYPDDFYQRDADDMAAMLDCLGVAGATIVGWSEGAAVALCLAATRPELVARLIFWGGVSAVDDEDIASFEARRDVASWPPKVCAALTEIYGPDYWGDTWGQWCDVMGRLHAAGGAVGIPPLEQIACPSLVLHGAKDPLIKARHAEAFQRQIAGAEYLVFEDAGHNPHLTHSDEFNRLVRDFIARS
jgi:valacyclovir hydrolase